MKKEAGRPVSLDLLEALAVEHMVPQPFKFVVLIASCFILDSRQLG